MGDIENFIQLGRDIGLEGEDLREFVKDKEAEWKEEKARLREDRRNEREEKAREREARQFELQHAQTMRQNEQAHELKLKELELQLQVEKSKAVKSDVSESKCKPSLPKLPVFNEVTDSIDAYILRFERLAVSAKWDKTIWAVSLASLLQGKALETYQRLSPVEASNFDCVK